MTRLFEIFQCGSPAVKLLSESTIGDCLSYLDAENNNYYPKKCTITDGDDYSCNRIKLDENTIKFNSFFNSLRCLEYSDPRSKIPINKKHYIEARKIFIKLFNKIFDFNKKKFAVYGEFSRELYQRSIYYYQYINKFHYVNNIPVYSYVKNNDCLIPLLKKGIIAPLVHFDTHSDHKEFENFDEYNYLLNKKPLNITKIQQLTYDIGCFSSYYLYYSKSDFFWFSPPWSLDCPDYKKEIIKMIKKKGLDEVEYIQGDLDDPDSYISIHGKLNKNDTLLTQDLNEDFILSIDLDYFCTNGLLEKDLKIKNKKKLRKILADSDPGSYGRTRYKLEFNNPFYNFKRENEDDLDGKLNPENVTFADYSNKLQAEINLILQRLEQFKNFLLLIQKKNISPVIIVLSDSCNVNLSRDANSITMTNDFCPQNLVLFIRNELFKILQQVYSHKEINFSEWPENNDNIDFNILYR